MYDILKFTVFSRLTVQDLKYSLYNIIKTEKSTKCSHFRAEKQ